MKLDPEQEAERERLFALFRRMVQLGQLLPGRGDEIEMAAAIEDPDVRANAKMVLREMAKVEAEVNAMLAASRTRMKQEAAARAEKRRRK